ncbi:metallophosphoesterase [Paraburkholderia phytofirmans PsJN]|uniref:Metallophosphoesterase n=2 Tax=Paraburkholderia phytofirmans TaxID=261302 RepID=B2TAN8_PARPJ|nr:metallophosphoesterase [Paraburkholderia phytofirmans PsJN]
MHIGDLHLTEAELPNHLALRDIVAQANAHLAGQIDFAVLPGDNADDGTPAQYDILRAELDDLEIPVHIIPGDHDFKSRNLDAFHTVLRAEHLPKATPVRDYRCFFLDYVSAGTGGPDFRLGQSQMDWLKAELQNAAAAGKETVVFAHGYPADLADANEAVAFHRLLREFRVAVVDMGHTHYNELANDGRTIYASTRSTGQIEEGPAGFSLLAVDSGVVSWRFKPLDEAWPVAMITSPADRRLVTRPYLLNQVPSGQACIRVKAWSASGIRSVDCRIGDGEWQPMVFAESERLWTLNCAIPDGACPIVVRATDRAGSSGFDSIEATSTFDEDRERHADGSDRDTIGAWEEKHLMGTQLGPNRNGRKW